MNLDKYQQDFVDELRFKDTKSDIPNLNWYRIYYGDMNLGKNAWPYFFEANNIPIKERPRNVEDLYEWCRAYQLHFVFERTDALLKALYKPTLKIPYVVNRARTLRVHSLLNLQTLENNLRLHYDGLWNDNSQYIPNPFDSHGVVNKTLYSHVFVK